MNVRRRSARRGAAVTRSKSARVTAPVRVATDGVTPQLARAADELLAKACACADCPALLEQFEKFTLGSQVQGFRAGASKDGDIG